MVQPLQRTLTMPDQRSTPAGYTTHQEMRQADVPVLDSEEELLKYIRSLVDRPHDDGTRIYAMSMSAVATLQFVANKLSAEEFQVCCAELDILRRNQARATLLHNRRAIDSDGTNAASTDGVKPT